MFMSVFAINRRKWTVGALYANDEGMIDRRFELFCNLPSMIFSRLKRVLATDNPSTVYAWSQQSKRLL